MLGRRRFPMLFPSWQSLGRQHSFLDTFLGVGMQFMHLKICDHFQFKKQLCSLNKRSELPNPCRHRNQYVFKKKSSVLPIQLIAFLLLATQSNGHLLKLPDSQVSEFIIYVCIYIICCHWSTSAHYKPTISHNYLVHSSSYPQLLKMPFNSPNFLD